MTVQCVLFDLDNTLTDRRQSITHFARQFATDFAGELGEIPFERLESAIQYGDGMGYRPKESMFAELASNLPWQKSISIDRLRDYWYEVSPGCMEPRPGMVDTLKTLNSRGMRTGIITNGRTVVQQATIDALNIRQIVHIVLISEAAGVKKPTAEIFHLALDNLKINAADTWYVGDHPQNDVIGATDSGLTGVWLNDGIQEWSGSYPNPRYQIRRLTEILALLESDS
jgi:putative hydrolase of the HAD superfamily